MFIFDIEMLGHLQSRCFNSDPYQAGRLFCVLLLLFVSVSAVISYAGQLPCCCRLWLLVQKFCQTLKFLHLQTKWVVRDLGLSQRILGCYDVSLGKCFTTLNAVFLGSSSPRLRDQENGRFNTANTKAVGGRFTSTWYHGMILGNKPLERTRLCGLYCFCKMKVNFAEVL